MTIKSYKGFDAQMKCRGFQFAIGGEYVHDGAVAACESGFHACEYPLDVLQYYPPATSVYAEVEQDGDIARHSGDSKVASSILRVKASLPLSDLIQAAVSFTLTHAKPTGVASNSGDYGVASNSGVRGVASNSGVRGVASNSGACGVASNSGARGVASNIGDYGVASNSGIGGVASNSGDYGAASNSGIGGVASNSGARGVASNSGVRGVASNSGDYGVASNSGVRGVASNSGISGVASNSGDYGAASNSGDYGAASNSGVRGVAADFHGSGRVKGVVGSALFALERNDMGEVIAAAGAVVGKKGIKPDTWYVLKRGKFVVAK